MRFTYDLNGVLAVDTEVPLTQQKQQLVIINKENRMSEEEIRDRLAKLEQLKLNPLEEEENKFALEWGMRLYAQCNEGIREEIEKRMQHFAYIAQKDPHRAERARKQLMVFLAFVEKTLDAGGIEQMLESGQDWYGEVDEGDDWYEDDGDGN